jgi:glyoxylase-like metal-dependent hydrolase (beta-lactamase superfamily II)
MISQYWIDQIPARPLSIQVKTQSGEDANLSAYTTIEAVMLGTRNEEIDLTGSVLDTAGKSVGNIIFRWPTTRSLLEYPGDYVLQIKLSGTGRLDFTSTHTLRVRELGRVR